MLSAPADEIDDPPPRPWQFQPRYPPDRQARKHPAWRTGSSRTAPAKATIRLRRYRRHALRSPCASTWAPVGCTPVIKAAGNLCTIELTPRSPRKRYYRSIAKKVTLMPRYIFRCLNFTVYRYRRSRHSKITRKLPTGFSRSVPQGARITRGDLESSC